ncbi:RNA polymerase sigma factor RpoD/SigA [Candidatus Bipolaricaulota bacterium]|nr:RNA polymerase sigma factor RpoD/SigA [Candidatus Bipolaricaulota bacterium]MCK4600458.1 RNA polymerase sigma factor RpoD/SigA [Candidatus Bipolaricaulota bacterium]
MRETLEKRQPVDEARSSATTDILRIYFREISRFPLLSQAEEQDLARAMSSGVDGARERLITSNLRLVVKIAQDYSDVGLPLIDLIQEGNIGLIEAVDRFDVERGYRLSTYASWWIRRTILTAITDYSRMIRIPDYLFRAVRRLEQMRSLSRNGRVDEEEITQVLGVSVERLRQIETQVNEILSLDQVVGGDGDETREELIADSTALSPEKETLRLLFHDELERVFDRIPARQALALRLHYGIEDGCPYSLAEVGRTMKISRERARQLVKEGLNRVTENWGHDALSYYRGLLNE